MTVNGLVEKDAEKRASHRERWQPVGIFMFAVVFSWRPRCSSSRSSQTLWPVPHRRSRRRRQGRCQARFAPHAMRRTQLRRRPPASRSDGVRVPSATRRFARRSTDVDWRFRGLSLGQRRLATRRHACVKAFRLARGRRCRRTPLTEWPGRRSRIAKREWRAWFEAHGTAGPPASPRSLHRIGTRSRCSVRVRYFQRTGGRKCAASGANGWSRRSPACGRARLIRGR